MLLIVPEIMISREKHIYHSFIAIALVELPSSFVLLLLMDIWGRKPLLVKST